MFKCDYFLTDSVIKFKSTSNIKGYFLYFILFCCFVLTIFVILLLLTIIKHKKQKNMYVNRCFLNENLLKSTTKISEEEIQY